MSTAWKQIDTETPAHKTDPDSDPLSKGEPKGANRGELGLRFRPNPYLEARPRAAAGGSTPATTSISTTDNPSHSAVLESEGRNHCAHPHPVCGLFTMCVACEIGGIPR